MLTALCLIVYLFISLFDASLSTVLYRLQVVTHYDSLDIAPYIYDKSHRLQIGFSDMGPVTTHIYMIYLPQVCDLSSY